MYVLSASNRRVSIKLVGKDKVQDKLSRFEELTNTSLSYMGVSSPGIPCHTSATVPNMKELDLTGNLLSDWKLPLLWALNLSTNFMSPYTSGLPLLKNIHALVLNNTAVDWVQVQLLGQSLPTLEELHCQTYKRRAKPTQIATYKRRDRPAPKMEEQPFEAQQVDLAAPTNLEKELDD